MTQQTSILILTFVTVLGCSGNTPTVDPDSVDVPGDVFDEGTSGNDATDDAADGDDRDLNLNVDAAHDVSENDDGYAMLDGDYPIEGVTLDWFDCPLYDDENVENNPTAQCAEARLPLFWDRVGGPTIPIYYKRLLSTATLPQAQLWLLNGGPGASGVSGFPAMMQAMQADYPELDVYTIDHRGVGRSARLGCPDQEEPSSDWGESIATSEFEACVQYLESEIGDRIHGFRTTFAAIDLAAGINATRETDKPVFIWGGSYGSYLAMRYLQIYPDQVDGVILEGIAAPDITFATSHEGYDIAGRGVLAACMADPFCAAKFPDGVETTLTNLLDKLGDGHCKVLNMTPDVMRYILNYLNFYHPLHSMIPAAIYRLDRCTEDDAWAFYNMYRVLFGDDGSIIDTTGSWSMVLNFNISYSELWNTDEWENEDAMREYWLEIDQQALFGASGVEINYAQKQRFPAYNDTTYDDGWAETTIPILMLQGVLDPATPWSRAVHVGEHFNGPNQTFVGFPGTPHNVTSGTPLSNEPDQMHCGQKLFVDFLKAPTSPLDLSCVDAVLPINFEGTQQLAEIVFGATDYWEAAPAKNSLKRKSVPISPELADVLARLRADIKHDKNQNRLDEYGKQLRQSNLQRK